MGKIAVILFWVSLVAYAKEGREVKTNLGYHCISCHKSQQIPNTLIYRRYLMKYSIPKRIEEAMLHYLKAPKQADSIMPPQFFLKFPMKEALDLDDVTLRSDIHAYIQTFDVKQYLKLAE